MIRKIKNIIWKILIALKIGGPIQLMLNSELVEDGWYKSFNLKQSVNGNGDPIPWNTYSFIRFIEPRLKKHFNIFEYGCGNSTLWYAKRVKSIQSVEHDRNWFDSVTGKLPSNAKIIFRELSKDGAYAKEILESNNLYHIAVIDGRDRNNCAKYAVTKLTDDGIIIYDNTQVPEYTESIEYLLNLGFKRIDFIGNLPIVAHTNTTSIFYRNDNCLGI